MLTLSATLTVNGPLSGCAPNCKYTVYSSVKNYKYNQNHHLGHLVKMWKIKFLKFPLLLVSVGHLCILHGLFSEIDELIANFYDVIASQHNITS